MPKQPKPIENAPIPPKNVTSWALYNKEGTHIIIQAQHSITGEWFNMDYYATYEDAYNALSYMEPEDIEEQGVHILEVTTS